MFMTLELHQSGMSTAGGPMPTIYTILNNLLTANGKRHGGDAHFLEAANNCAFRAYGIKGARASSLRKQSRISRALSRP